MAWGIVTAGLGSLGGGSKIAVVGNVETRVRRLYFSPGVARIECDPPEIEAVARKAKQGVLCWIEKKAGERELDFDLQVSCRLPGKLPSLVKVDYSLAEAALAVSILEGLFRREGITTSPRSDLVFSGSAESLSVVEVTGATRSGQQKAAQGQQKTLLAPFLPGDQRLSTLDELFARALRVRSKWNLEEKVARTKGSAAESLLRLGVLQVAESLYLQDLA